MNDAVGARWRTALGVGAATALVALAVAALPAGGPPATASAPGPLWQRVLDGLYGDQVVEVALTGNPPHSGRWMLLLPAERAVHRLRDDGHGWDPVYVDPDRPGAVVHALAVARDDVEGRRVYAGLQGRTRFARSDDAGRSWVARAGPAVLNRVDRLTTSEATGRVYAAQADRPTLYTSLSGGETWAEHPLPGPAAVVKGLFTAPDDPVVYMVRGEVLYKTLDDPGQWTVALRPNPSPPMTAALAVDLAAVGPRGRLHAAGRLPGGGLAVLSSDDRGESWIAAGWPAQAAGVAAAALGAGEVRPGLNGVWLALQDGRVFESEDLGVTWLQVARLPLGATRVVVDPHTREVWVGSDGLGLYRVRPEPTVHTGAVSVEALAVDASDTPAGGPLLLLAVVLPERRSMSGTQPPLFGLFESEDGATWARRLLTTGLGTELLASPGFIQDRRLYSGRMVSEDGGSTWRSLPKGPAGRPPHVLCVGPLTATLPVVYALDAPFDGGVGGSGLVLSEDGGATWTAAEAVPQGIVDVVASPAFVDDRTALLVTAGGFVYRAADGVTFRLVGRIPSYDPIERNVFDLEVSPAFERDGTVMAAVEDALALPRANVYVSNNRGATWQPRTSGLDGNARPRVLSASSGFGTDRVVFLGTERRDVDPPLPGIFGSDSGGADWFPELYLPPSAVRGFAWAGVPGQGTLYAVAGGAGLYARDLAEPVGGVVITPPPPSTVTVTVTTTPGGGTQTPEVTATPTVTATLATPTGTEEPGASATDTPVPTLVNTPSPHTTATEAAETPDASPTVADTPTAHPTLAPARRAFFPTLLKRR